MSKRYIFPQQDGVRKKAKLDVTVSDHNIPLSQNIVATKDGNQATTWGDDNNDEFLLLASQACEDAFNDQFSSLPDYSLCMQPSSTSTQNYAPIASTSKTTFTFKKPSPFVATKLAVQCERISPHLPDVSKVCKTEGVNVSDDIIINDNLYKGQDSDHIYRLLLKLEEENAKLKSDNGKLLDKCVTKEGEVSILRTQLKSCQVAVDNARLEKVRVQERVQMEFSEKLTAAKNVANDLRTQLDFKNLEIISVKEKCKMLESNKIKLTQVTVAGNDISMSQKVNSSYSARGSVTSHLKKLKSTSSAVQTENSHFIHLNIPTREESSKLAQILPVIMTPTNLHCSILENDKLRRTNDMNKCRVFSAFHKLPSNPSATKDKPKKLNLNSVYENLSRMIHQGDDAVEYYLDIFKITMELLQDVKFELDSVRQRMTTAFHKQMDERYIEATCDIVVVEKTDLLSGRALYQEEQAILARRMTAILVYILEDSRLSDGFNAFLREGDLKRQKEIVNIINRICTLLDNTTCSIPYSGLLLSITVLLNTLISPTNRQILEIVKTVILSRPMHFVVCEILRILSTVESVKEMCCGGAGNLKVDYEQGVLLYKRESCVLQVLSRQAESAFKCIANGRIVNKAVENTKSLIQTTRSLIQTTRSLIQLYGSLSYCEADGQPEKHKCDCHNVLMQVIVYGLNICANILKTEDVSSDTKTDILAVCRGGIQVLYRCAADVEFVSRLGHNEGHLLEFCEILRYYEHPDIYSNMLSELFSAFQSTLEESVSSYHKQAWLESFDNFTITD